MAFPDPNVPILFGEHAERQNGKARNHLQERHSHTRTLFPSLVHNVEVAAQHWLMALVERYLASGHVNVSCWGGLEDVANCDLLKNSGRFPRQLPSDTIRTRLEFFENVFLGLCISYNYLVIKLFVKSPSLAPSIPSLNGIHKVRKIY